MQLQTLGPTKGAIMSTSPDPDEAEFEWLLKVDVSTTISQLTKILNDCLASIVKEPRQYDLVYCGQNQLDVVKVNANLQGYRITNADINIKLTSKHLAQTIKTCIKETPNHPFCWRLNQIQDASNHLSNALDFLTSHAPGPNNEHQFQSAEEILQLISDVMNCLYKSRTSLLIPKKSLIEELQHSQNMQSISPALPLDYSISFYVQAPNLVCSVYQLAQNNNRPQMKAEFQAEVAIPYLTDMLVHLNLGLQACQQLKDKIQTLKVFVIETAIGREQQELLDKYGDMMPKLNNQILGQFAHRTSWNITNVFSGSFGP